MDFNEVDIPVFVRFISELTGKNFVLDETIKKQGGKISVYSPTKVTPDQAYNMFVSALEVARIAVVQKGNVYQIVQMGDLPPERGVFVYKLKNANATDMAKVLKNWVARSQTVAQPTPGTRPPIRPLTEFEAPVQVFADKPTNSIIISSTKTAYARLQSVIRELDIKRRQVFVEAVILEVQVDRLRQIGTDPTQVLGAGKSGALQGIGGINRAPEDLASVARIIGGAAADGATGGAITVLNTINVRAFMQLLMNLTDTNILSTPQVLAADNQKAKIVVGENRPFPTGQAQGGRDFLPLQFDSSEIPADVAFTLLLDGAPIYYREPNTPLPAQLSVPLGHRVFTAHYGLPTRPTRFSKPLTVEIKAGENRKLKVGFEGQTVQIGPTGESRRIHTGRLRVYLE